MALVSDTTAADVLQDLNNDFIVRTVLDKIAKKSNTDKDELTNDIASLLASRMNYVWRKTMSEEEAQMEGLANVTEDDLANVLKSFQHKYKLDDSYIEYLQKHITEHVDESTIERNGKHSKFKTMRDKYFLLKIIFLPITVGLAIFDAFTDFPMFSGSVDLPFFDCVLG